MQINITTGLLSRERKAPPPSGFPKKNWSNPPMRYSPPQHAAAFNINILPANIRSNYAMKGASKNG